MNQTASQAKTAAASQNRTHTPGPWFMAHAGNCIHIESRGFSIAKVGRSHSDDARLIAAAPELLAAARSAHRAITLGNGRQIDWDAIANELSSAIAKATTIA